MHNEENASEKNTYIYLDFNGKLSSDVFQNQVFFRIANLHKKNPLVQVNDYIFKGTYDQSIGTNLFFEEIDDNSHTGSPFEKQTPVNLKYFLSSTKVLNLQQVKIPQTKAKIQNEVKSINYNLNWDYKELLEKFENGTLQIEDISLDEMSPQRIEIEEAREINIDNVQINTINENETIPDTLQTESQFDKDLESVLENSLPLNSNILEAEYEQLNVLARRPVKRAVSPELVAACEQKYREAYEYHNVERQVLQPRTGFMSEVLYVDEDTFSNCVDIERCVLYGLIPASSNFPRILSKDEKEKLLTLENFDNLSLAARYYVFQNLVDDLEKYVNTVSKEKLQEIDEYGRTSEQTLEIYKKLKETIRNRLLDIKLCLRESSEN